MRLGHLAGRHLSIEDILRGGENGGPVLKGRVRHTPALTEGHQICDGVSVTRRESHGVSGEFTFALLGEQQVGLRGGRQIGHTVASIKKGRPLVIRQCGIRLDFQGLVVAEVAGVERCKHGRQDKDLDGTECQIRNNLPLVVVLDFPATLAVDILSIPAHHLVGDNCEMATRLVA